MRFILIHFLLLTINVIGQNDSLSVLNKIFYNEPQTHQHIIDIRFIGGGKGLGYNYVFSPNNRCEFGGRIGALYRKESSLQVPESKLRHGIRYSFDVSFGIRIWKSTFFEFGAGYYNYLSWPQKTNINPLEQKPQVSSDWYHLWPTLKVYFWKHLMVRGGVDFIYDDLPSNWYKRWTLSIGYKF